MKTLFLSTVPESFDPTRHAALGPWCFIGAESVYPDWEKLPFAEPFATKDQWAQATSDCHALVEWLVKDWTGKMNARHGRDYSNRFWRILLLDFLIISVQGLWYRYLYMADFAKRNEGRTFAVVLPGNETDWRIADLKAFFRVFTSAAFDQWMSSLLVGIALPGDWPRRREGHIDGYVPPPVDNAPSDRESQGGRLARRIFGRLAVNAVPGMRIAKIPLSLFAALLPRGGPAKTYYRTPAAAPGVFPQPFLDILERFLLATLPRSLTDGFTELETKSRRHAYYPRRLLIDVAASPDDGLRMIAAQAHEAGEKLVSIQHGGWYGIARTTQRGALTEYPYHGFISWGWRAQEDIAGNFMALPSLALHRIADKHRQRNGSVILVGANLTLRHSRIGWMPKLAHTLDCRRQRLTFIGALEESPAAALVYRPYLRKLREIEDEDFLARHYPGVPSLDGDLTEAMLECRLLILDHPGSTMLSALAANVPTIGYWDPAAWPLCRQAKDLFAELVERGIVFADARLAAQQVNRIWPDVGGWWSGRDIQDLRRRWCRQFAWTTPLWPVLWLKGMWSLSR